MKNTLNFAEEKAQHINNCYLKNKLSNLYFVDIKDTLE